MLSHELRNPLAAVMNATTRSMAARRTRRRAARCQAVIERQATHMKQLLDDLLDVSRITSAKFAVAREDIDLHEAIETAIEATRAAVRRARHRSSTRDVPRTAAAGQGRLRGG